jgi:hypothetical protein
MPLGIRGGPNSNPEALTNMRVRSKLLLSSLSVSLVLALSACSGSDNGGNGNEDASPDATPLGNDSGPNPYDATMGDTSTPDSSHPADTSVPDTSTHDTGTPDSEGPDAADGGNTNDASDGGNGGDAADGGNVADASDSGPTDAGPDGDMQMLVTTLGAGAGPIAVTINQGTAIGEGALNGATPSTLFNVRQDTNNTETITSATNPFGSTGHVPDTAAGFCEYPTDGGAPTRISYTTGAKFETADAGDGGMDPMVPMAPFYFPLVYTSTNTLTGNAFGGKPPIIGLFDWRPKDIDEAVVVAESDDDGQTWYFMQKVLELNPDYTNPISGGHTPSATNTGCPATIGSTNANTTSLSGSQADDGWGHAAIIQLPGAGNAKTGQLLYLLDRNTNQLSGADAGVSIVDNAPLHVIPLAVSSNKFPIWNTNQTNNDIKSITSALSGTPDAGTPVVVKDSIGLKNPDGIMAVFPTALGAAAGSTVTVLYVQKILNGDLAFSSAEQCTAAPVSGKINHDISNVRLATTTDGITFVDQGIVSGLNDPTTVDYNQTRWISPRGTLLDINGDGSRWGLYFSGGNCLDGDSDAFHYLGYAESSDMKNWTVYNDINHPIASINKVTAANQAGGAMVTIPATEPVFPTEPWFAQRLYAPSAVQIDPTHLSMTFAGYGVQTPNKDLLSYRQIGNVVLTVSKALPVGVPNNINAH